ncbi:hypothetical protein BH09ACT1_BH09ACT1_17060 [soil metagenome]
MSVPKIVSTPDGPLASGSSPELLRYLLEYYEWELLQRGVSLQRSLAPGVDESEVRGRLAGIGLRSPEEVIVWFGWHNGPASWPRFEAKSALPNFRQARLDDAIQRYRWCVLEFQPPSDVSKERFYLGAGEGWLRLVDDNLGCAIDCSPGSSQSEPPRIRSASELFLEPGSERAYRAVSLCTLVTWWLESLHSGAFRWDAVDERWIVDRYLLPRTQRAALFS